MMTKDDFLKKWTEVSGFDFRKLLEDNQNISLPMLTVINRKPAIFAFIYSCFSNDNVVVFQRHFWTAEGHQMMLCRTSYNMKLNDVSANVDEYMDTLGDVVEILFLDKLSPEDKARCEKYFSCFKNESLKRLYFSENKPLATWASKQSLL